MNVEFLLSNAGKFAFELRKSFPEEEMPIRHFVTEQEVVVLSNKKLYVFYVDGIIDYKFNALEDIDINDNKSKTINLTLMKREFNLTFTNDNEHELFVKYFHKYKD